MISLAAYFTAETPSSF